MKLIINVNSVSPNNLFVVNGSEIIREWQVMGPDMTTMIDKIFSEYYIEAVYFNCDNNYARKFENYIENKYQKVEVIH